MTTTIKLKATDIIENDELKAIEFSNAETGEFCFQAMWDPRDEHTPDKIAEFRVWAARMATRLNYELSE